MRESRNLCLAAAFAATMLADAAMADKPTLTSTEAFRTAFGMSFYAFDGCGDVPTGELYRRALVEKVEHCPFTAAAKTEFGQWTADTSKRVTLDIQRYISEHDKLPERLDGMKVTCKAQQQTPAYQKTVALLAGYAKGEVKFDAVVPDACDTKAGAP